MIRAGQLALVLVVVCATAQAQIVPTRQIEMVQAQFNNGNYAEALKLAREGMALANFTGAQRIELHRIAGLSAFNLNDPQGARGHFLELLQLNPDYQLDPFAVPPPAIKFFEQVRRDNADALNLVRQQLALRSEQDKRSQAEQEKVRTKEAERVRHLEELAGQISVRTVEKRSFLVTFVPFGAGQFQQGRTAWGTGFAVSETVMALTSIISFLAINSLFEDITYTWTDRLTPTGKFSITVHQIPDARKSEATVWNVLKFGTGGLFYALWALGVGDAIWHHHDEVVTETQEKRALPRVDLYLGPGSAGAGLTFSF